MKSRFFLFFALVSVIASPFGLALAGQEGFEFPALKKWHGTLGGEFKAGSSRQVSQVSLTMPLAQTEDSLLFFDFRGWVDDASNEEYQAGFVFRKLIDSRRIVGVYGYFDQQDRKASGNSFDQVTIGAELLTEDWEVRVNGYLPTDMGGQTTGTGTATIVGNRLFLSGVEERAYRGVDYEVGKLLKAFGDNEHELRAFLGGYYFENGAVGYESIAGPRGRLELRLFDLDLLGAGSRVTLSGEVQWDEVRETEGFGGVFVQVPLGKWRRDDSGRGTPFGPAPGYSQLSRLERRMLDPVRRDVDVVTNTSGRELASDATGDPLFVASVDQRLDQQLANAGINGTVVVDGVLVTGGNHQLRSGQALVGGNTVQTLTGTRSGIRVSAMLPGSQGGISSLDPMTPLINLANHTTIDGLQLSGGQYSLYSPGNVSGVTLVNNHISGSQMGGLFTQDFTGTIVGNAFVNHQGFGVQIGDFSGDIRNNRITDNAGFGLNLLDNRGVVSHNQLDRNVGLGLSLIDNYGEISHNQANQIDGFAYALINNYGVISDNVATNSTSFGFAFIENHGRFTSNRVMNMGSFGIAVLDNFGEFSDNSVENVQNFGINLGDNYGVIANNRVNSALGFGFSFRNNFGEITGNEVTAVMGNGFTFIQNAAGGVFSNQSAINNAVAGYMGVNNGTAVNNTGSGNGSNNTFP